MITPMPGSLLLSLILLLLFLQLIFTLFINRKYIIELKTAVLYNSLFIFLLSTELLEKLDTSLSTTFYINQDNVKPFSFNGELPFLSSDSLNVYFTYAVDGISIYFVILTTFLTPICILVS
jgi:NADH-quinone oxidoreductase subunit M